MRDLMDFLASLLVGKPQHILVVAAIAFVCQDPGQSKAQRKQILEDWINDFKYDMYPEIEVNFWGEIASRYLTETEGKNLSSKEKMEINRMAREVEAYYEQSLNFPLDAFWGIVKEVLKKDG
jgi:hypothetical protein